MISFLSKPAGLSPRNQPAKRCAFAASLLLPALLAGAMVLTFQAPAAAQTNQSPSLPTPQLSNEDHALYLKAFKALDDQNLPRAKRYAKVATDQLPAKAIRWIELSRKNDNLGFSETARFMSDNPDWPRMTTLQKRAEERLTGSESHAEILAFFATREPSTGPGLLAFLRALEATGQRDRIKSVASNGWRNLDMARADRNAIRSEFRGYIDQADHIARLDRLLWEGKTSAAKQQATLTPKSWQALAVARSALRRQSGGVDGALARVPVNLRNDQGLIYERAQWRRKKGRNLDAAEILRLQSGTDQRWVKLWWKERAILARRMLKEGNLSLAYELSAGHGATEGVVFAEGEFLAGWIALRFLNDAEKAFPHFQRMYEGVGFPVSLSRAAYWAGRAAEAGSEEAIATQWYQVAAEHGTSFYGQMAALHLTDTTRPAPPVQPPLTQVQIDSFQNREMIRLLYMLSDLGASSTFRIFYRHLSRTLEEPSDLAQLADMALALGQDEEAVYAARQAIKKGVMLPVSGYPVVPLDRNVTLGPDVVFGLIRQESAFEVDVISSAGARGLMQLMPATAKAVARQVELPYRRDQLLTNHHYNIALGSEYLRDLLRQFDGSLILSLAGYNAGPHRSKRWMAENGDPRESAEAALDWIELIPFTETRNYVQRVLENITVYRQRLTGTDAPLAFTLDVSTLKRHKYAKAWEENPRAPRPLRRD